MFEYNAQRALKRYVLLVAKEKLIRRKVMVGPLVTKLVNYNWVGFEEGTKKVVVALLVSESAYSRWTSGRLGHCPLH